MPELPEVETVKQRLSEILTGKTISEIEVLREKSFKGNPQQVAGLCIVSISRRAKLLRVRLNNHFNLLIHLKMTGQLIYTDDGQRIGGGHPTADWVDSLPSSHTRVVIHFEDGSTLFFNDMRVFGWIKVLTDDQVQQEYSRYGPDANSSEFTAKYLKEKLQTRTIAIKQAIMINEILAGVGNIYASEALFLAGIDPQKSAKKISLKEIKSLVVEIKKVIEAGIKHGGTTFDGKFVDVSGLSGNHQEHLHVYGLEGEKCDNCGSEIKKVKIGGRGTYYCEYCQK